MFQNNRIKHFIANEYLLFSIRIIDIFSESLVLNLNQSYVIIRIEKEVVKMKYLMKFNFQLNNKLLAPLHKNAVEFFI